MVAPVIDLVVMEASGRHGLADSYWEALQIVVRESKSPVLVMPEYFFLFKQKFNLRFLIPQKLEDSHLVFTLTT